MMLCRALLPEGMGRYQVPLTAGILVMTILDFGVGQSNIFFLNKHRVACKKIVMNSVWFGLVGSVVLVVLIPLLLSYFKGYFGALSLWTQIIFAIGIAVIFCFNLLRPVLTAGLKVSQDIGARVANQGGILIAVACGWVFGCLSVDTALVAVAFGNILALAVVVYFVKNYIDFKTPFLWGLFKETITYGLKIVVAHFVYILNVSLGLMLVRYLMPEDFTSVGYYGRAVAVCGLVMLLPTSVGPLLYAQWSGLPGWQRNAQVALAMRLHFAAGAAIITVLMFLGPWIIAILYGKAFLPAVSAMRILTIAVACRCVCNVCHNLLASDGRAHVTGYIFSFGLVVTAALAFLFVPYIGISGAALADVVANSMVLSIGILLLKKDYGLEVHKMIIPKKSDLQFLVKAITNR